MTMVKEATNAHRIQHLIITIFGLYARNDDGALAVSELIRLLSEMGVEAAGVRSSVSRLKRRGVLDSVKKGQSAAYRLSPRLDEVFRAGDERIFAPKRAQAGDPWILASFSVPESERHLRHRIRSILTRLGCGQVSPGLWIAPDTIAEELSRTLARAELVDYVELFRATHLTSEHNRTTVARWWNLTELDALYRDFLLRFAEMSERWPAQDAPAAVADTTPGAEAEAEYSAFVDYIELVTAWRRLPYLDPGLPAEYLPEDWSGLTAEALFLRLHTRLGAAARNHADGILHAIPAK